MSKTIFAAATAALLFTSPVLAAKSSETKVAKAELFFKNCKAAAAAGYTDMQKGEPGYAPKLDRDHDGIACETDHNWGN